MKISSLPKRLACLSTVAAAVACSNAPAPIDLASRSRASAALRQYESCDALGADLKAHLREELRTQILQAREGASRGGAWFGGPERAVDDSAGAEAPSAPQEGVDFSGTNNQESGVDEADSVKTDGRFIYTLNGRRLEILGVPTFGELTHVSTTSIEGYPQSMLLSGDRAVVFSSIAAYALANNDPLRALVVQDAATSTFRTYELTKLTVIDLGAARTSPRVVRELYLEGSTLTAREVDGTVRSASYAMLNIGGLASYPILDDAYYSSWDIDPRRQALLDEGVAKALAQNDRVLSTMSVDAFLPRMYERQGGALTTLPFSSDGCRNYSIPEDGVARGITSLLTLDLQGEGIAVESDHVVTNWPVLYASQDTLLLAEPAQDFWWYWGNTSFDEATNIHRFDMSGTRSVYTGSGRVDGTVLGQFALSEHEGVVRVAATKGQFNRWWSENPAPSTTQVTTLAGEQALVTVGSVDGIAPGERLWSTRFTEDRGYLVTFQNVDPLWVVDLSNPTSPRILGELEVPGVSTYIHPLSTSALLTIGIAGTNTGLDWGNTQLSLFDVADEASPRLASTLSLSPARTEEGWASSWSEAQYEHKAFQYWAPTATLAVPLSTYRQSGDHWEYVSKLALIHVAEGDALSDKGSIDHSAFFNSDENLWWSNRDIRRSIFMGDFIYALSDKGVTCHKLEGLSLQASVALPGSDRDSGYAGGFVD